MRLFKNKSGQFMLALARERQERDKKSRVRRTKNLYSRGYTTEQIAERLKVTDQTIKKYMMEVWNGRNT